MIVDPEAPSLAPTAAALRETEESFRFLAETVPVQIWTALPDGNLDYVTEQTAQKFGLTPQRLLADGWQNVLHPDDLPLAIEKWTQALTTGETYEVEFRLKLADGNYAWHLARAVPQRNSAGNIVRWFGTNTNIEEQREQRSLLALEAEIGIAVTRTALLSEALSSCADALVRHLGASFARIWTVDVTGKILQLRASAGLYTHLDGPHGRVPIGKFKIGQIAAERKPHLTNTVVGDPRVSDQAWAIREGMVAFAGYPIVLGNRLLGVVATFATHPLSKAGISALESIANSLASVIDRLDAEAERERLLAITEDARSKAELANRAKDEFLATASHELRTPLNAILGWSRLLKQGLLDPVKSARAVETIERNANAQVRLIEDILDGSRIITGKLHLEVRSLDLTEVVRAGLDAVRPAAAAKSISLHVVLDPAAAHVKGDPDRLQQVVWNLMNNAIKFTPKGGAIEVELSRVDSSIHLVVKDNGQGIAPDFLPHVFERFRQADGTTTRRHGGLGLGLALVRHLAEAHGGTVHVESAGKELGATFTVVLPVEAVQQPRPEAESTAFDSSKSHPVAAPGLLSGVSVLVVDDEPDARDLVATLLKLRGADVTTAGSVEEALAVFEIQTPTILVSDIGMPTADGYSLIQRMRALRLETAGIPAIALTAYAREEDRRRAIAAGFQAYLAKPVEPEALVRAVSDLAKQSAK
ncbi:MAG: ATP-binding protein [Polyangiaceae bacterium]